MFTVISAWVKNKLFSETGALLVPLFLVLGFFLIWNSDSIMTRLGFETKSSLVREVSELKSKVEALEADNLTLSSQLNKCGEAKTMSEDLITKHCESMISIKTDTNNIVDERRKREQEIRRKAEEQKLKTEVVTRQAVVPTTVKSTQQPRESEEYSVVEIQVVSSVVQDSTMEDAISRLNIETLNNSYDHFFGGYSQ